MRVDVVLLADPLDGSELGGDLIREVSIGRGELEHLGLLVQAAC